ncbi:hypothetical protein [Rubellimicrobium roseum]|uniref:Uncharacterized protein n=1 Tax=Rubellimicrobium roseum TaxID=687525 RepID=A0A5C4N854_9RHOB|nr:hypothetical protein [Rubellimicrobium roseum]TNC69867.1 hypothetical protein FHG71_13705 [Rubellimicrobium roseum]
MTKPPERLMYMLALRQMEARSDVAREAYGRLEASVAAATKVHPRTVILDWLEAELARLPEAGEEREGWASLLLREAVAFGNAVRG